MPHLHPGQHIHLVGIGGSGLSAIARVLLGQGYTVSGSDRSRNEVMAALERDGATVYTGHAPEQIQGADAVIMTSAITTTHVEIQAALAAGIPVYKRQDIMADLMVGQRVIAVAGTKGKTTTTAMIVHLLRECGGDPSYIVGGVLSNTGTNAGVGNGGLFVVEADEYDNMFHGLRPDVIVLTNVEYDHPDFFKTPDEMVESFRHFLHLLPRDKAHLLVACGEDAQARQLRGEMADAGYTQTRLYGLSGAADIHAGHIHLDDSGRTCFDIIKSGSDGKATNQGTIRLQQPGKHNVLNALAAYTTVHAVTDAAHDVLAAALESFASTGRRFELRGEVDDIAVIDDYAHNPTSIRVTLEAARQRYPGRAIWAVWQPHTYSRTQALLDGFAAAFAAANHVLVTDIYAAREQPMPGVDAPMVAGHIQHAKARPSGNLEQTAALLLAEVASPAVILIMSAGDAPVIGQRFLDSRRARIGEK
ncbi:MAG: UDP-N-acetylmuramate--L-alanine ligase [Anaerolineaceae bacterium]|nr:UDP-N-acetylmuramate--L-alanine ligase [Anaerolineaceae bacterium]